MDIVKQSAGECGACSIVHSLGLKKEEVDCIISDLKQIDSVKNKNQKAFGDHGIHLEDIVTYVNKKYTMKWALYFLDRHEIESYSIYVRRVYDILKNAHRPIIEIRTFVAKGYALDRMIEHIPGYATLSIDYKWFNHGGHFHVVESVQEEINEWDIGFSYRFIESITGKVETGYIYFEKYHKYTAYKDYDALNEKGFYEWHSGYPFMLVITPNINCGSGYDFYHRKVTILRAIVH